MSAADALTQDDWVPAQEVFESGADFRFAESARMCRKRMREIEERDANGKPTKFRDVAVGAWHTCAADASVTTT